MLNFYHKLWLLQQFDLIDDIIFLLKWDTLNVLLNRTLTTPPVQFVIDNINNNRVIYNDVVFSLKLYGLPDIKTLYYDYISYDECIYYTYMDDNIKGVIHLTIDKSLSYINNTILIDDGILYDHGGTFYERDVIIKVC